MSKLEALAKHLEVEQDEINESKYDSDTFEHGRNEYLVLTDSEADQKAEDEILNSVWAFNSEFLASYMPDGVDAEIVRIIQEAKSEDANEPLKNMLTDENNFIQSAIAADGRGHFLARYDGEEHEIDFNGTTYFIYKIWLE